MQFLGYLDQVGKWPPAGRHILAHFVADSICVYQAYRPVIARYAVDHQRFGGDFIVAEQRQQAFDNCAGLRMPEERLYRPADQKAAISVGIESPSTDLPAE